MEFIGQNKIRELAEMLNSNSNVVNSMHKSSEQIKSSIFSILEHCEEVLIEFDDCKCQCENFKSKFERICMKIIGEINAITLT